MIVRIMSRVNTVMLKAGYSIVGHVRPRFALTNFNSWSKYGVGREEGSVTSKVVRGPGCDGGAPRGPSSCSPLRLISGSRGTTTRPTLVIGPNAW